MIQKEQVIYTAANAPHISRPDALVPISDKTYQIHLEKLISAMQANQLDAVVIYADKEHGDNFYFFTGFEPRFEEAALVVRSDGSAAVVLGNEMYFMHEYVRLNAKGVHCPYFSLPNQPMEKVCTMEEIWAESGLKQGDRVGLIGWKLFTSTVMDNTKLYDMPYYCVDSIRNVVGDNITSAAHLLLNPDGGLRTVLEADEIANYEVTACWASTCVEDLLAELEIGKTELELGRNLSYNGQPTPCHPMCASGERWVGALVHPRNKKVEMGDKFNCCMSLRGGLTNRTARVARTDEDLPEHVRDYVDALAKPYFAAMVTWYETVGIGVTGGEVFDNVQAVFPKETYGWTLNPGHLCASEEWMCSPMEKGSGATLKSGMIVQMDIIPNMGDYSCINAEDGVALADEALRKELAEKYPEMWARVQARRAFMEQEIGIQLKPEVLPLSNIAGYVRPLLLDRERALKVNR